MIDTQDLVQCCTWLKYEFCGYVVNIKYVSFQKGEYINRQEFYGQINKWQFVRFIKRQGLRNMEDNPGAVCNYLRPQIS